LIEDYQDKDRADLDEKDEILRVKPELVRHLDLYMNMYVSHKRRENKNLKSSFFALTEFVEFSRIVSDGAASFLSIRLNSKHYEMFKKYATKQFAVQVELSKQTIIDKEFTGFKDISKMFLSFYDIILNKR